MVVITFAFCERADDDRASGQRKLASLILQVRKVRTGLESGTS
jgi:hypothetical protein